MKPYPVYALSPIAPVKALDCWVWDAQNTRYLDLYGGHAVISIGHSHPHYIQKIAEQIQQIGFYSNAVENPLQDELARRLGQASGYEDYQLFLCNSGAEANENALKLASFHTGKRKIVAFKGSFHGRTSAVVAATDSPALSAPLNRVHEVVFVDWGNAEQLEKALSAGDIAAVMLEPIQGVGGVQVAGKEFLELSAKICQKYGAMLVMDEVQAGYGRSGKFFAHQFADIRPDLITVAKGMGNGFPIAGVLIAPHFEAKIGQLGTTFGGNHLACAAALAVLDVIAQENLLQNAHSVGEQWRKQLENLPRLKEIRGQGLMLGLEFDFEVGALRDKLLFENHIFTGSSGKHTIRLLPPLTLKMPEATFFTESIAQQLQKL